MRLAALAFAIAAQAAFADERASLACTDFYACVNGARLKQAQIAPDRAGTVDELREANTQRLIKVLSQVKPGDPRLDTSGSWR